MTENAMSPDSPHYQFDPTSLGWLHRKVKEKELVTAADLARIGTADRGAFADPVFQEQMMLALEGRLPTRDGRPPEEPIVWWKTLFAALLIEERAAEIRAERKANGTGFVPGLLAPRLQAAEEVAGDFKMHMTGQALLNRISAQKKA